MSRDVRVKIDYSGVLEVLNSPEVRNDVQRRVDAIRDTANRMGSAHGFEGDVITTDRPHGAVWAGDIQSQRSNAKHNTILKSLDAGRG